MKILIVVPRFIDNFGKFHHFPIGLAYIASALKDAGHDVHALNLNHHFGQVPELVQNYVSTHKIDVCASGGLSPHLPVAQEIFTGARLANPNILNICGGGLVSSDPDICLDMMDIDIGVVGEGEISIVEAVETCRDGGDLALVAGIVFKDDEEKVVRTLNRPSVMDLSAISWPDYELLGIEKHLEMQSPHDNYFFECQPDGRPRSIDMVSSRSCPFSCTFCFHPIGKVYRERPLDDFFAELEFLIEKYRVNMVIIVDELFSLRKARLHEFCERMKGYDVQWMVQLHVNSVDQETLKAMSEAGSPVISYGVESMSQPVLDSMQKKSKKERIDHALALTYENNIGIRGNIIFGDTAETIETANETMHWWAENRQYQITLTRLQVFPGSPDYIMAVRDGLIDDRLEFSIDLPTGLNIANINSKDTSFMFYLLTAYKNTVLNPVLNSEFRVSERQFPGRDVAYDIDWQCPRCDHDNRSEGLIFNRTEFENTFLRLHCVACRSQWDVENKIRGRKQYGLPLKSDLAENEALRMTADPNQFQEAVEIAKRELVDLLAEHAKRKLEKYSYERLPKWHEELEASSLDLLEDPFDPLRHVRFAHALGAIGLFGGCAMHLRQASLLDPDNEIYEGFLNSLKQSKDYAANSKMYFMSVSDDAPTFRQSRQTGDYNRKKEPAFPVYSRAGNRASVVTDAAD